MTKSIVMEGEITLILRRNLKRVRVERGLSVYEVARRLEEKFGIKTIGQNIFSMENKRQLFNLDILDALAQIYGVRPVVFLDPKRNPVLGVEKALKYKGPYFKNGKGKVGQK